MIQRVTQNRKVEKTIAVLYVYLLPVRMIAQFEPLQAAMHGAGIYFDVILHALGVLLYLISHRGRINIKNDLNSSVMQYTGLMILLFNLSSVIMACVIQAIHGNHGSESAFNGILGMLVYFTQYFLMFWYNREVFTLIAKEELLRIFRHICVGMLALGYFQFLVMNIGGIFATVYDKLDIFGVLYDSDMPKLCLTGSEGASAGTLIGIMIYPFLFSQILTQPKTKKYVIQVLLWLPIIYATRSSTAYILVAASVCVFLFVYIRNKRKSAILSIGIYACMILVLIFAFYPEMILNLFPKEIGEQIQYLLFDKATDLQNGSTVARTVPLLVNWGAFTEYPILGVGNGLQGYFYEKYFPAWAYNVASSDVLEFLERSKYGITNGGVFFPGLLSGYGVFGLVLIAIFLAKIRTLLKSGKEQLGAFYWLFVLACPAIILCGFQGDFYAKYYIWFILSIPFMVNRGFSRVAIAAR